MNRRHLGELEQLLLYAVRQLQAVDSGANGPSIRHLIESRTGRVLSPGAIYTALDRLEQRGLVKSELGLPTAARGGKRKRQYELRNAGEAALRSAETALAQMARPARASK